MKPPPSGRFLALDGLRGIAALAVLVFHLFWNSASADVMQEWLPDAVTTATGFLRSGVAIFFVISGFVIAYTTSGMTRSSEGGRFALRRQVRLDPPYYATLALVLLIELTQSLVPGLVGREFTPLEVLLNMLYLQDIVGVPAILSVAWTLCLEVQFYLLVVVLAILGARLTRTDHTRRRLAVWSASALGIVSLMFPVLGLSAGPWVLGVWWMFAVGMMLAWFAEGTVGVRFLTAAFTVLVVWGVLLQFVLGRADPWGGEWFAIATGLFIAVLIARNRIANSPGAVMLYFGRISYPLYLVHLPVISIVTGAGFKLFPDQPVAQVLIVVFAGAAAIGGGEILHRWVEVPAIRWSKRLKRRGNEPDLSGAQVAAPPPA